MADKFAMWYFSFSIYESVKVNLREKTFIKSQEKTSNLVEKAVKVNSHCLLKVRSLLYHWLGKNNNHG